jgi:serine/threonine-protein kinase
MGSASPSQDDSGVVAVGTVLDGRYRIDAIIGKGGMGRVYRGEHTGIGRAVAIKVLHATLGRSKEAVARFQREALASGRLDHPNIVGVSDFGVLADGSLYLVMEALDGEPLGTKIEREKHIPWPESIEIMRGVLAGLRHAHDRGVVHRDIKPDNIFLARKDGDQVIKILDFGIAKLYAGNADDPAQTRAGLTVGTPAYLSPEQAVGGAITPASDLYSVSVVLYEMLVGRPPYDEQDPLAMLTAHVSREPPSFHDVAPDLEIPAALEDTIRRGLAKVSAERIGSATEYWHALEGVLGLAGYAGAASSPRASSSLAIPAGPHSRPISVVTPSSGFMATPMPFSRELGTAPTASLPTTTPEPKSGPVKSAGTGPITATGSRYARREPPPIPRHLLRIAVIVFALAVLGAIGVLIFGHSARPDDPTPTPPTVVPQVGPLGGSTLDHDTRLKAALHDLEAGPSCAERKSAIPKLIELGDDRAIPSLKRARYRGTGGFIGIGESNANACLKADAEAAIKALGGK